MLDWEFYMNKKIFIRGVEFKYNSKDQYEKDEKEGIVF